MWSYPAKSMTGTYDSAVTWIQSDGAIQLSVKWCIYEDSGHPDTSASTCGPSSTLESELGRGKGFDFFMPTDADCAAGTPPLDYVQRHGGGLVSSIAFDDLGRFQLTLDGQDDGWTDFYSAHLYATPDGACAPPPNP